VTLFKDEMVSKGIEPEMFKFISHFGEAERIEAAKITSYTISLYYNIDNDELKQLAYIGVYKAYMRYKDDLEPKQILFYIRTQIKNHLRDVVTKHNVGYQVPLMELHEVANNEPYHGRSICLDDECYCRQIVEKYDTECGVLYRHFYLEEELSIQDKKLLRNTLRRVQREVGEG